MKTPEELKALKEEVEALNKKLAELTEEEMQQLFGGAGADNGSPYTCPFCGAPLQLLGNNLMLSCDYFRCPKDGDLTYFWEGARWEPGHIG